MTELLTAVAGLLGAVVGALAFMNTFTEQRNLRTRLRKDVDLWKDLSEHPAAQHRLEEVIHRQVSELTTVTLHQRSLFRQRLALNLAALAAVVVLAGMAVGGQPQEAAWPLAGLLGLGALLARIDSNHHRQVEGKMHDEEAQTRTIAALGRAAERRAAPGGPASPPSGSGPAQ